MKKTFIRVFVLLSAISIFTIPVLARVGVGVNTGKIQVDEKLKAGMIYQLPSITVINTGEESSDYKVSIAFQQDQSFLVPMKEWFTFSPQEFYLEPGKTQVVDVKLTLPLKTEPGDFFCYLEARPTTTIQKGGTSVGVAAAAKLYFTVSPANIFLGIYYRALSLYNEFLPWSMILGIVLVLAVLILILRKFIHIEIKTKSKKRTESKGREHINQL